MITRSARTLFLLSLLQTSLALSNARANEGSEASPSSNPNFVGYQNLPSRDGSWPGAYRGITGPRLGGYTVDYPFLLFTSLNRSKGQAGVGVVFAHELIAVERKLDILLMDGTGVVVSVFNKEQSGQQIWPVLSSNRAVKSPNGGEISIQYPNTSRLTLRQVTKNFQGDPLYLLSQIRGVGGQMSSISFTWDQKTQTPRYQKIDSVQVSGSVLNGKGSLSFRDERNPLSATTYTFDGSTVEIKDVAGALIAKLGVDQRGYLVSEEDRYGYRSTQTVDGAGLVTRQCDANKACVSHTYNASEIITAANTSLYPHIVAFNPKTKYPMSSKQLGWETFYRYRKTTDRFEPFLISSVEMKSPTGAKVNYAIQYDSLNRVIKKTSSLGESSEITYDNVPLQQPIRLLKKVKDRIVSDVRATFKDGLLVKSENQLVAPATPGRSVERKFDAQGRVVAVIRPGLTTTLKYEDARHPASPTEVLTNGREGARYKLNAAGQVVEIASIPAGEKVSIARNKYQAPSLISATLAGGGGSTTAYSYQAPGYVNGITRSMRHPEAGVVEMPSWEGTWDNKFRDLVSLTGFNPNHNSDNAGPVRNPEWFYPKTSDVVSGTDKPTGVLADASGCSPCAASHFKDSQGISLPESRLASRCDGSAITDVPAPIPTEPPQ